MATQIDFDESLGKSKAMSIQMTEELITKMSAQLKGDQSGTSFTKLQAIRSAVAEAFSEDQDEQICLSKVLKSLPNDKRKLVAPHKPGAMLSLQSEDGQLFEIDFRSAARMSRTLSLGFADSTTKPQLLPTRQFAISGLAMQQIVRWMEHHRYLDLTEIVKVHSRQDETVYEISEWNWEFFMNQDFGNLLDIIESAKTLRMTQLLMLYDIIKSRRPEIREKNGSSAYFPLIRLRMDADEY